MKKIFTLPVALSVAFIFAGPAAGAARLTILHTNDTHGHLTPFSYPAIASPGSDLQDLPSRRDIGGIARRATLVSRIRADLESKGTTVWLVDAGDFCDGSAFSTEYHGDADVAAMNRVGYDFATLGNHEFNNPLSQMRKLISYARYPILLANAMEKGSGRPIAQPTAVRQVGGARIGLFGLVTRSAASYRAAREGGKILPEIETARATAARLRDVEKADLVILISHCGEKTDERIAREVPGIDVIVGGHSHSRLPIGEIVWRSDELKSGDINGTVIVQAFQWGGELGRLDLLLERDASGRWKIDRYRERLLPITDEIQDDPRVAALIDSFWRPIATKYTEVIGMAAADFAERGDDMAEYNLVADAVRAATGVDAVFENLGGVRASLLAGPITRGDLAQLDPFDNTIVTFSMKGREIRRLLERHAPAVSGIRYRIFRGKLMEATIGGSAIDDARPYTCATNSYYAARLKGFRMEDRRKTGRPRFDAILDHIRRAGTISPAYDGRRVVITTR